MITITDQHNREYTILQAETIYRNGKIKSWDYGFSCLIRHNFKDIGIKGFMSSWKDWNIKIEVKED